MKAVFAIIDVVDLPLPGTEPSMSDQRIKVLIPFADGVDVFKADLFYDLLEESLAVFAKSRRGEVTIQDLFPEAFS